MSLLLDARKKTQRAQTAQEVRCAAAGNIAALPLWMRLALAGMIFLLGAGAAYYWYAASAISTTTLRPISTPPSPPIPQPSLAVTLTAPQSAPVPEISAAIPVKSTHLRQAQGAQPMPQAHNNDPIHITQQQTELIDPLLRDAYLAYRNGKLDEAQQLYLAMFKKDAHNADVLLGLAAIAQQHGEKLIAAQYYSRALTLDPRNALANAGISALSTDEDDNESRLRILLREQGDSAALHFALGNLYAGQSRWGEAQQAYFNAYTLESGNPVFAFNLAVSLDHLGQKNLAARHYQNSLQLDQSNSAGLNHAQISQRIRELIP
jgi:tetratricopeptide (TPR) repeat protein